MNKKLLPLLLALLGRRRSIGGWIMLATVAVIYLMVQPTLNARFGLNLPGLLGGSTSQPVLASTDGPETVGRETDARKTVGASGSEPAAAVAMGDLVLKPNAPPARDTSARDTSSSETKSRPASSDSAKDAEAEQAPLGKLTQVGSKIFETTAGLRYGPGSVDGHRLLHIMQHAKDRPDKPVHGVFEGDEYKVRAMIDEAYLIADLRGPPQAKKTTEGERTVWKVDMKRKVGYLGGQVGQRKGHPSLSGIQLVLEGRNVITAFPIDPRR